MKNKYITIVVVFFILTACKEHNIPRPRGYFRIDLPKKEYRTVHLSSFSFQLSSLATIEKVKKDTLHWINISYKKLNASIYLSFFDKIDSIQPLIEDARDMAYKHTIKADDIVTMPFAFPNKRVFGNVFNIEGDAASSVNFYLTDSTTNFLRGALYFNCEPNKDSLKPVNDYIKEDIQHLLETFNWEK